LNLSLADEHVGDVTISTQVIATQSSEKPNEIKQKTKTKQQQ
jgi:ssRNA-specific RNase YbeY (16S rRNA maturation enzyme)